MAKVCWITKVKQLFRTEKLAAFYKKHGLESVRQINELQITVLEGRTPE